MSNSAAMRIDACPSMKTISERRKIRCLPREMCHSRVECGEARIGRLPVHVPEIDLLNDDGDLEDRERLIKTYVREIATGVRRISIQHVITGEIARPVGDGCQRIKLAARRRRCPVGE